MTPLDVLSWELHRSGPLVGTRAVVFESSATAHADFPASFLEFFDQQRIAFNGQMFNALHYLAEAPKVLLFGNAFVDEGGPSASLLRCVKRCALAPLHFIQYLHVFITLFANWFALAASYLMLHILTGTTLEESKFQPANGVKYAFKFIFVLLVLGQAVSALGVELSDMKLLYTIIACVYSIMFALLIIMAVWMASYHHVHAWLLYAAAASAVLTLVAFSIHGKLYSALKSALQFTLTSPVYFLMVPIHALATCNNVAVHQRIRHVAAPSQQDPLDAIRSPTFANGRFPVDAYPGPGAIIESPWDPQEVHNLLDVGTRPHTDQADMHRLTIARRQFAAFRTRTLMLYLGTNWLAVSFFLSFNFITYFPWALVGYGLIVTAARFVGSMVALLSHWLHSAFRLIDRVCCCCVHTHAMPSHPASGSVQPAAAGKASAPHHHSEKQPSGRSSFSAERASVVGSEAGQRSVPSQSRSPSAHKEFSRHSATSERRSVTPQRVEEARDSFVAPSPQYTLEHVVHLNREYLDAEAAVDAVVASSRAAVAAVVENAKQHSSRQLFGTGDSSRHVRQDRSIAQLPTADRRRSRSPSDSGSVGSGRHSNSPLMVPDDEPSHPHSLMQLAARGGSSRGSVASQGTASQASIVSMGGIRASGSVNSLRRLVAPAAAADGVSSHLHEHHADLTAVKPARRASSPTRVQAHTPGRTAADAILPRQSAPQSPIVPARAYTAGIPALEEPTIRLSPSSSFRTPVTSHKHSALVEPSLHTPSDIPIRFGGDGGSVSSRASSRATDLRMVSDTAEVDAALQHAAAMAMDLGMDPIQPLGQFLQVQSRALQHCAIVCVLLIVCFLLLFVDISIIQTRC